VAIATPDDVRERTGTVGRPVLGVEVAAFSRQGERLPAGQTGELHVRSPAVFEGYVTGEDAPQREGFLALGDLGHLDEEGYLHVEGREDEMVVVGGENVYPIEVEEAIAALDGVDDVAVVGEEDPEYGEVLTAFYTGSAEPDAIRSACEESLATFKVPRRFERLDALPRTATGKIRKADLPDPGLEKE
jgi:fatty-acyl-CoA synthase